MRSLAVCLACLLPLTGALAADTDQPAVTARVTALVRGYSTLVGELQLNQVPNDALDYYRVMALLNELGGELEAVSRMGGGLEALTPQQWRALDEQSARLSTDLQVLRCLSLPLRVWGYLASRDDPPEWGLAVDYTLSPLHQHKGFVDATPAGEVVLQARAGETAAAQIVVVPLTRDLGEITVTRKDLTGPAGAIKLDQVRCEPIRYDRLPDQPPPPGDQWWRGRVLLTKASVPRDLTQAYILTVAVPEKQPAGSYQGTLTLAPPKVKALTLRLKIEITNQVSEARP